MGFNQFSAAVAKQIEKLLNKGASLYTTSVSKDDLWVRYLDSFPEGTNPIFRARREYDCNACKQFIRAFANVVIINVEFELESIWDIEIDDSTFQTVASAMSALVKSKPIENLFLTSVETIGKAKSFEQVVNGRALTWHHFACTLSKSRVETET